jgi:hypothetical protein
VPLIVKSSDVITAICWPFKNIAPFTAARIWPVEAGAGFVKYCTLLSTALIPRIGKSIVASLWTAS